MNLVTRRDAGDEALGGRSSHPAAISSWCPGASARSSAPGNRTASAIPTTPAIDERDVAAFIAELNQAFPALDLTLADITLVHRGVVPAVVARRPRRRSQGHEQIRDHAAEGIEGTRQRRRHEVHDRARGGRARHRHAAVRSCRRRRCRAGRRRRPCPAAASATSASRSPTRAANTTRACRATPFRTSSRAYGSRYRDVLDWRRTGPTGGRASRRTRR